LTLTPRIVKGWDIPSPADTEFFSGTGSRVGSQNELAFLSDGAPSGSVIRLDINGKSSSGAATLASPVTKAPSNSTPLKPVEPVAAAIKSNIGFDRTIYELDNGSDVKVRTKMSGFPQGVDVAFRIRFNKNIINVKSASQKSGSDAKITFDNEQGIISVSNLKSKTNAEAIIGDIVLTGLKSGLSYFIVEGDDSMNNGAGQLIAGSAKIVVK